jgi:hypothetical protein
MTGESEIYQIRVKGVLDKEWSESFNRMAIRFEKGITTLHGPVADQSELHGLLSKIRDLNLTLLSVTRIASELEEPLRKQGAE